MEGATAQWPERIWVVRHGQSAGNVARDHAEAHNITLIELEHRDADVPLSQLGKRQSQALGAWVAGLAEHQRPQVVLAMDRIVLSVQKVASIMSQIAEASLEQFGGLEQVGGIIVQLDTSTQQNAALVVDASTVARSMQDQAMALALEVGKFQLGDVADRPSQSDSGNAGRKEVDKDQRPRHFLAVRGNVVSLN